VESIIIPVSSPEEGKSRLAGHLTDQARQKLALAMFVDVLEATEDFGRRFVVTRNPAALDLAQIHACTLVLDEGKGLNQALAKATACCLDAGTDRLLVLPADVALVNKEDLLDLFSEKEAVVVAVSDDGGTNGLLLSPPDSIKPAFGFQSASAHVLAAREAGLSNRTVRLHSMLLDVDSHDDLVALSRLNGPRRSVRLAKQLLDQ